MQRSGGFYRHPARQPGIMARLLWPQGAGGTFRLFFMNLSQQPFFRKRGMPMDREKKVAILNFAQENSNYGALLVAYSLEKTLEREGYAPCTIWFRPCKQKDPNAVFDAFRGKHLHMTKPYADETHLRELNSQFDRFIVGSDQVWRYHWELTYTMRWVSGEKVLLAYGASFGTDHPEDSDAGLAMMAEYLRRFDAVSVREGTGESICENALGVDARLVLDPTLLLGEEDYREILDADDAEPEEDSEPYIAYVFLDQRNRAALRTESFRKVGEKYALKNALYDEAGKRRTFSGWMRCIKNSRGVVSDSYHGTVFSLIFRKNFVVVDHGYGTNSRFATLFDTLGIERERFLPNVDGLSLALLERDIDYTEIVPRLEEAKKTSLSFLREALAATPKFKAPVWGKWTYTGKLLGCIPLFKMERRPCEIRIDILGKIPSLNIVYQPFVSKVKVYLFRLLLIFNAK